MKLTVTVGASSSGKSTYAAAEVKKWRGQVVEVNRDNLRKTLFGITGWHEYKFNKTNEALVTNAHHAQVRAALASGKSVIVSDTNLKAEYRELFKQMADEFNAEYEELWFDVELDELLARNMGRGKWKLDEELVKQMHSTFVDGIPEDAMKYVPSYEAPKVRKYERDTSLPKAVIFDLDGTLAHMNGKRGPFEWDKVALDDPSWNVVNHAMDLQNRGIKIVVTSGRDEVCRDLSAEWLKRLGLRVDKLVMRKAGDQRNDADVKEELFYEHVVPFYNVVYCVDDRDRVVQRWRDMGLECWQVADGNF